LIETRQEFGPARMTRQHSLRRDITMTSAAFAFCELQADDQFNQLSHPAAGPCYGLMSVVNGGAIASLNVFQRDNQSACECLVEITEPNSACEESRDQLTSLRRIQELITERAELVLAYEVCGSAERETNSVVRGACVALERAVVAEHSGAGKGLRGQFNLLAPLPTPVAVHVDRVRAATDGRFMSAVIPENFLAARDSICPPLSTPKQMCSLTFNDIPLTGFASQPDPPALSAEQKQQRLFWRTKRRQIMLGICRESALVDLNANRCRNADIYIDERGELHLNRPLSTRSARKQATLCIDISDFDDAHPLMVTLGMEPTGSVPERIWPGETIRIGALIDRPVTSQDVLHIHVLGKARGVSLAEVLRVNGVLGYTADTVPYRGLRESRQEACRIARSWVPVVDHEVPIGAPGRQAVIPVEFGRGRDGETRSVRDGDYVVLWVRNIEPAGSVLVEYARGQTVGYQPPPLLGEPADARPQDPDGLMNPNAAIRGSGAGVGQPLLPRRARYPGSRVLRLGTPEGNQLYDLKVCTQSGSPVPEGQERSCAATGGSLIVDEKLMVHGEYHFGLRMHFGYTYFPVSRLVGRRTPAAQAASEDIFEVVQSGAGTADYDVALLLATYPFGRDPRRFSYKPWRADYWKHSALLTGFTVRSVTPWNDFYLGASLPVANGVSLTALSHISRRNVPVDAHVGDLFGGSGEGDLDLNKFYDTQSALVVGVSVGLSFDYDLFERAFISMWERLRGRSGTFASGAPPSRDTDYGGY
jgi:hypothetical protein